jgi:hypothetical protein
LGCFATPEEAALAYNRKALELHGEHARLNVIERSDPQCPSSCSRRCSAA